jgi:predicted aspartyl protease
MLPFLPVRRALWLSFLLLLAHCGPQPVVDCDLRKVAEMPLEVQDNLLVVPAGINGKWVQLVVDTGAERTTIAKATADRLELPHDARYTTRAQGIGGVTTTTDVRLDRFVLGGVHFPLDRVAVGGFTLKTDRGLNADGLLGADVLLAFDMDIDVPGGKLTLYHATTCPQLHLPWDQPAVLLTGVRARKDRLMVPINLDGVEGTAFLDTGAQVNLISGSMVQRMGLTSDSFANDPTIRQHGVGPAEVISHRHRFNELRIGPVVEQPAVLVVMDGEAGFGDALIGEQFLAGHRVWISFRSLQVYVSGGR